MKLKQKEIFSLNDEYKKFLDRGKTERECARDIVKMAQENGYVSVESVIEAGQKIEPGMKIYALNRDKSIILFVVGKEPIEKGMHIVGGHIDSPRLDLKPFPLYEDSGIAMFKTHYYGGVRKYQWASIPLAMHGVVMNKNGEKINILHWRRC